MAPDKLRSSASAAEAAAALAEAARRCGHTAVELPLADGGEGTLEVLGGPNRTDVVTGPLGDPVRAPWRRQGDTAVIESASAAGLVLVGGPEGNDPVAASTHGVGELIAAAREAGARRIIVGMGGTATTDGGLGALRALYPLARMQATELVVACDVRTRFCEAAEVFAPQKGATPAQVRFLRRRLERLAQMYRTEHGVDVTTMVGAGAAGGLAGGLAVAGGRLVEGFDLVAGEVGLDDALTEADLVVTAEGHLDATSFEGKVVGGVVQRAERAGVPVVAVVGDADPEVRHRVRTVTLVETVGPERAFSDPLGSLASTLERWLRDEVDGVAGTG